jgi:hypothetical protein
MESRAVASIVSVDYISHAITVSYYLNETNPGLDYVVLVVGNSDDLPASLPDCVKWICWDKIVDASDRILLASLYTPFELCCVLRGRFHNYFVTKSDYSMWVMIDTDIGIYSSLEPLWEALRPFSILLTPHLNKPVPTDCVLAIEGPLLCVGLYNAGVVAMRRSRISLDISLWMTDRLERFGRAHKHRISAGIGGSQDFEFVDQNWLNYVPIFFREETLILQNPVFNLGHWNLREGNLYIAEGLPMFNGAKVVFAHFSGLPPADSLDLVSKHTDRFRDNPSSEWASIAATYVQRLNSARDLFPPVPYSYALIQPRPLVVPPPRNYIFRSSILFACLRLAKSFKSVLQRFMSF